MRIEWHTKQNVGDAVRVERPLWSATITESTPTALNAEKYGAVMPAADTSWTDRDLQVTHWDLWLGVFAWRPLIMTFNERQAMKSEFPATEESQNKVIFIAVLIHQKLKLDEWGKQCEILIESIIYIGSSSTDESQKQMNISH